ncbi:MAG: hypothetical protein EP319_13450 [Deltaproteobacteria bacterium]|nr:MAG: hypothetical protein EP319_13450 [Deltaproteobacteria bacterium]
MENPYLDIFLEKSLFQNPVDILSVMTGGGTPDAMEKYLDLFNYRLMLTRKYAWAVPDDVAIKLISEFSPLIEVGAGIGYWAKLISEAGGDILAFDTEDNWQTMKIAGDFEAISKKTGIEIDLGHRWFDVQVGDENTIKQYPDRTLFLCWPPFQSEMGLNCLKNYSGEYFIFVGEDARASNNESFEAYLSANFNKIIDHPIPKYEGITDSLKIFQRLS